MTSSVVFDVVLLTLPMTSISFRKQGPGLYELYDTNIFIKNFKPSAEIQHVQNKKYIAFIRDAQNVRLAKII